MPERAQPLGEAIRPERQLVLVAEDDEEMRRLLATVLERDGYEVVQAARGAAVLEHLGRGDGPDGHRRPDLIVSDVRMPGLSGLELVAGLRRDGCATPVILITAFGDHDTHARGRGLGATDVLDKPFDLGVFRRIVRYRLHRAA